MQFSIWRHRRALIFFIYLGVLLCWNGLFLLNMKTTTNHVFCSYLWFIFFTFQETDIPPVIIILTVCVTVVIIVVISAVVLRMHQTKSRDALYRSKAIPDTTRKEKFNAKMIYEKQGFSFWTMIIVHINIKNAIMLNVNCNLYVSLNKCTAPAFNYYHILQSFAWII